jgi:hypothetical protein
MRGGRGGGRRGRLGKGVSRAGSGSESGVGISRNGDLDIRHSISLEKLCLVIERVDFVEIRGVDIRVGKLADEEILSSIQLYGRGRRSHWSTEFLPFLPCRTTITLQLFRNSY